MATSEDRNDTERWNDKEWLTRHFSLSYLGAAHETEKIVR